MLPLHEWHDHVVDLPSGPGPARKIRTFLNLRMGHMSGVDSEVIQTFENRLHTLRPRVVILDTSLFGPLATVAKRAGCIVVTQFQNCEYDFFSGEASLRGRLGGILLNAAYRSEKAAVESSDLLCAMSAYDKHRIEHLYELNSPVIVVNPLLHSLSNGLAAAPACANRTRSSGGKSSVVFLGSRWFQNRQACAKLIDMWHADAATLKIVGQVGEWVRRTYGAEDLDRKGIEVLGYVESLAEVLREADAMACPMNLGSGVKVKVIDALLSGCPALVSQEASQGFEFAQRSGFVRPIADGSLHALLEGSGRSPKEFADRAQLIEDLTAEIQTQRSVERLALEQTGVTVR